MARGNKFGTFGGVFTPAILTILGVIMYMRLPWIVGEGGLYVTLGVILASHVISVTTGLSVASIATDKKVHAGGPYYIVSRSLGLPIGGTLGLALFVGLSFSVSLYAIGFSESLLGVLGMDPTDKDSIRIAGSLTLLGVTAVTLVSTAFAIRIQFFIMAAIAISLVGIFGGAPEAAPAEPLLEQPIDGESITVLFGIFFPAVTGFTAGVNMSGDLKDPRKALPRGTLAAIGLGLVVYVGLATFFAFLYPREALGDPNVLLDNSVAPWMVIGGVWGATLSSALGSILGAPRILQAKSLDRLTPRVFGKGVGKTNEPRNALWLTFGIAELGILIGELNVIAEIVSMFFIMTYGFLNLSAAVEAWVSPDFRPDFKIPRVVPWIGAITAVAVMIFLNVLAMIGATALLIGIFMYFKRRELTLETGDTWEGVWSSVVRSGLHRLARGEAHQRNWKPNLVVFTDAGHASRTPLLELGQAVIGTRGVLTEFQLVPAGQAPPAEAPTDDADEEPPIGVFHRVTPYEDRAATMSAVCRYHGFSGLQPNTTVLDWRDHASDPAALATLLGELGDLDLNVLLNAHHDERGHGDHDSIDIWWAADRGNISLGISLLRFITSTDAWRTASARFLLVNDIPGRSDQLFKTARRLLDDWRVDASVKVVNNTIEERPFEDWVRQESQDTDLTLIGLPSSLGADPAAFVADAGGVLDAVGSAVFYRACSEFPSKLAVPEPAAAVVAEDEAPAPVVEVAIPPLRLPDVQELEAEAKRFAGEHEELCEGLYQRCLSDPYQRSVVLAERMAGVVRRYFGQLDKGLDGSNHPRQRKTLARVQGTFLFQSLKTLIDYSRQDLPAGDTLVSDGIEWFASACDAEVAGTARRIEVARPGEDFAPDPNDERHLRRLKRWRRFRGRFQGGTPVYTVRTQALAAWYLEHRTQELAHGALAQAARSGYATAVEIAKLVKASRASLELIGGRLGTDEFTGDLVASERDALLERLDELARVAREQRAAARQQLKRASRELAQSYADDLARVDVGWLIRKDRHVPKAATELRATLNDAPHLWHTNQTLIVRRAKLELHIASLQHRLRAIVRRAVANVTMQAQHGLAAEVERLLEALRAFRAELGTEPRLKVDFRGRLDGRQLIDDLVRELLLATSELPDGLDTIGDDAIEHLEDEPFEDVEVLSVSLRRLVEFLIEAEFIGRLQQAVGRVPMREQEAIGVTQDVVRLIQFNLSDFELGDRDDEAYVNQLTPIVDNGIERVQAELEELRRIGPYLAETMERRLDVVIDRTDSYAITGSAEGLKQYIKSRSGPKVLTRFGAATRLVRRSVADAFVNVVYRLSAGILYRQSAGTLLARRIRAREEGRDAVIEGILRLVDACTPRPEVLGKLPFYYQQLFLGKSAINQAFWVGRREALAEAERAVENYRKGFEGALVVVGERNSGKTSFCQFLAHKCFERERVYHVFPPPGGSIDPEVFRERVGHETKLAGAWDEIFEPMPAGSALVLHDLEMWWERDGEDGDAVIALLSDLIDRYGADCFFILNLNVHAFRFLDRFHALSDKALAVVECGPFKAEDLKEIVLLRHDSTALTFELDGRPEDSLSEWRLARLFTRTFDYADGNVGAALMAWLANIEALDGERMRVTLPARLDLEGLDRLRTEWVALLVQLVLHKQVSVQRLRRVTGLEEGALASQLATLQRMGLVIERGQQLVEINPQVHHLVVQRFRELGLLG